MQPGERPNRHVGSLQRLDPADEQDDRTVRRQAEGAPRATSIAGSEEGVLDSRRHRLDHPTRVAVQAAKLTLFLRTADADRIAASDHLRLGTIAPLRFEVATLGLDPGESVERRDQRHIEAVLETMPGDAAEPVVAVDEIDAASGLDVLTDAVGEDVDLLGECRLGKVERPGRDVHHRMPRLDQQLGREVPVDRPACTSCTRRRRGRVPRRPRARTRSSRRCRRNLAARAGTCEGRSRRPAARL